jgi:type VI secretion system protein ImpA
MGSAATVDVESVLAPVPGDNPVGADLRLDESTTAPFARLMTLRSEAREFERSLEQSDPTDEAGHDAPVAPAWEEIATLSEQLLRETSKDLQIACWLIEARLRLDRFAGLRDGLRVAAGLVKQYWDSLYSVQDESDPTAKGEPVAGLNGRDRDGALVVALRKLPLTTASDPGPFPYWKCEQLHQASQLETAAALARQGPKEFYQNLVDDIVEARAAYGELADLLREKMDTHAPPTGRVRDLLEAIEEMARKVSGIREGQEEAGAAAAGGAAAGPGGANLGSREQALESILAIAQFFEQREPQSPIGYTLREAVRRARMPLETLLAELLPDEAQRKALLMNAGIKPAEPKPEDGSS